MTRLDAFSPAPFVATLAALLLTAGLAGCASTAHSTRPAKPVGAGPGPAPAAAPAQPQPQPTPSTTAPAPEPEPEPELATEARWLHEWFDGTPVHVALNSQGLVHLGVPAAYAFNAGSPAPKPPLRAVLDRAAQSLARHPQARLTVTVPAGASAREAAVRSHLQAQGLAAWRISVQTGPDATTSLLLSPGQAPVRRLDDDKLPPPPPPKPVKSAPPHAAASR